MRIIIIGYGAILNRMFRNIVICRLFNPGSKLKTVDYMERYLHVTYSVDQIYRFLDNLCYRKDEGEKSNDGRKPENAAGGNESTANSPAKPKLNDFKTRVEDIAYSYTKKVVGDGISVCFYDNDQHQHGEVRGRCRMGRHKGLCHQHYAGKG